MSNGSLQRELFDQIMVPNYAPLTVIPVRGKGSRVWDQDDNQYIDFAGGIAVTSVGHCHPEMIATLKKQGEKLWHLSNIMTNEPALKLAKQLIGATFAERVFFANSGSEANEAAFKLARRYAHDHVGPEKHEIIAFHQGFHGRTWFTVSVSGQPKYRQGFGPAIAGITHLPYNDIAALTATVSDTTCAIVMEPIQGEGGVIPATLAFAAKTRELCDKHNALLIMDEIQTGVGRLGTLYAYEQLGIIPDIMTTAKGLGNGFPVAAMLTTTLIAQAFAVGVHGSTYGGNPLACSIASKVLELVNTQAVLAGVRTKSERLTAGLTAINAKYAFCDAIRGQGLLLGCLLRQCYQGQASVLQQAAMANGLLLLVAGPDVVRIAPSLLIPDADIDIGLASFEQTVAQWVKGN